MGAHKRALKSSEMERFETTEIPEVLNFPSVFAKMLAGRAPEKDTQTDPKRKRK